MEDINTLIDKISKEVLKRIESNLPKILLIGSGSRIKEELDKKEICYEYHSEYSDDMVLDNYDSIIIEGMSNFELVTSALLVPGTNMSKLILKCRLTGKKVYVEKDSFEYKKYEATIDSGLKEKFESYVKDIANYGVEILKAEEIAAVIKNPAEIKKVINQEIKNETKETEDCLVMNKKLISEQDLRKLVQQGCKTVKVSKKSLITPLAKDYIKINNICIIRE